MSTVSDLDAARTYWATLARDNPLNASSLVYGLINDLEDARAELAEAIDQWDIAEQACCHCQTGELRARAQDAEARIATFLDDGLTSILYEHDGKPLHTGRAREIYVACRRALTGGTT